MKSFIFSSNKITFSSLPTKFEREIYHLINNGQISFEIENIEKTFNISEEKIYSSLEKFQRKIIKYENQDFFISGNIISEFEVIKGTLSIIINEKFITKIKSRFKYLDILFTFTEETSINFFLNICRTVSTISETVLIIDELKKLLNIDGYDRFYDFERYVLKKLKKEIADYTPYIFNYKKIKSGNHQNSKISHIEITISKKSYHKNSSTAIKILSHSKKYFNSNTALVTLIELLDLFSYTEVCDALLKLEGTETIEKDLNSKILYFKKNTKDFLLICDIRERCSNVLKLQNLLFKEIKKIDSTFLNDEFFTSNILKKLYQLSFKKELNFENLKIKLQIKLYPNKEYDIKIYSK